jgi:hypothetical protein
VEKVIPVSTNIKPAELGNGRINVRPNIPTQPNRDNVFATVKTGEVILNEEQQRRAGGPWFFKRLGVPGFAAGGTVIKPFWQTRPYQRLDVPAITRSIQIVRFAEGGRVGGANSLMPGNDAAILEMLAVTQVTLKQSQQQLQESKHVNLALLQSTGDLTNQLAGGIRADVLLADIHRQQKMLDRIRKDAAGIYEN